MNVVREYATSTETNSWIRNAFLNPLFESLSEIAVVEKQVEKADFRMKLEAVQKAIFGVKLYAAHHLNNL